MKKIKWNSKAREFVTNLEREVKIEIGALLMILQTGGTLGEPQVKPMRSIHAKAYELRVKDKKGSYRVIYVLNIQDQILIPHAFTKKLRKRHKKILGYQLQESRKCSMKISKEAKKMAQELGLSDVDAYIMELKAKLYIKSSELIKSSKLTHEQIAKQIGTSRSRINRIANRGENNISIELLIKLTSVLEGRPSVKIAA